MASSAETVGTRASAGQETPLAVVETGGRSPEFAVSSLTALVEGEIIPRLMLAHGVTPPVDPPQGRGAIERAEIDAFAPLALDSDACALLAVTERLLERGVSLDAILVDLLAPTARQLGIWWEEDRCDFVEVTMGLWRLQEVMREMAARSGPPATQAGSKRRALFVALPGDQHDFGPALIGELFHSHGWEVDGAPGASMPELLAAVGERRYDIVGLTVSRDCHSARLSSIILALRSVSLNPRVRVMVGGRIFVADPALATQVGADGTAPDARAALAVADTLIEAAAETPAWS